MELEEYARIADAEQRHWWYRAMPDLVRTVLGDRLRARDPDPRRGLRPGGELRLAEPVRRGRRGRLLARGRAARRRAPSRDARTAGRHHRASVRGRHVRRRDRDHRPVHGRGRPPRGRRAGAGDAKRRLRAAARARDPAAAPRARRRSGDGAPLRPRAAAIARDRRRDDGRSRHLRQLVPRRARGRSGGRTAAATPPRRPDLGPRARPLGRVFGRLAAAERRLLARRDVPFGLTAIVVAEKP